MPIDDAPTSVGLCRDLTTVGRHQHGPAALADHPPEHPEHLFAGLNTFEPGQAHEPHTHCDRDKLYVILQGRGELTVGEETSMVEPGDVAFAAADVVHSLNNPGPDRLIVLVAMGPPPRVKAS